MMIPRLRIPRRARGFTLIELMIAVAIVGILVRLAYPVYTQSVLKSHRADAKSALLDFAQREERFNATSNKYSTTGSPDLGYNTGTTVTPAAPMSILSGSAAYYQLSVVIPDPTPNAPANSFKATATAIGNQVNDTKCKDFSLTSAGIQSVSGTSSATPGDCW